MFDRTASHAVRTRPPPSSRSVPASATSYSGMIQHDTRTGQAAHDSVGRRGAMGDAHLRYVTAERGNQMPKPMSYSRGPSVRSMIADAANDLHEGVSAANRWVEDNLVFWRDPERRGRPVLVEGNHSRAWGGYNNPFASQGVSGSGSSSDLALVGTQEGHRSRASGGYNDPYAPQGVSGSGSSSDLALVGTQEGNRSRAWGAYNDPFASQGVSGSGSSSDLALVDTQEGNRSRRPPVFNNYGSSYSDDEGFGPSPSSGSGSSSDVGLIVGLYGVDGNSSGMGRSTRSPMFEKHSARRGVPMDPAPSEQFTGAAGSGGSSDLALVATQEGWRSRGREKVNSNTNTIQDVQQYDSGNLSDYWPPVYGNSRNNRSLVDMRSSGGVKNLAPTQTLYKKCNSTTAATSATGHPCMVTPATTCPL